MKYEWDRGSTLGGNHERRVRFQRRTAWRGRADAARKTRITIRLDNDVLEWFRSLVEAAGGGNYQTLINAALREYIAGSTAAERKRARRLELRRIAAVRKSIRRIAEVCMLPANGPLKRKAWIA